MINRRGKIKMETVYIAGGCLWGVQHFFDTVPGVQMTEAGRANGTTSSLDGPYDGYAECVKVVYDEKNTSISELMAHLFEIIDPYSLNKQGVDVGKKYQEQESAPLVREFLADTGMTAAQIDRVAYLVGHH